MMDDDEKVEILPKYLAHSAVNRHVLFVEKAQLTACIKVKYLVQKNYLKIIWTQNE